ncbi:unnamed protein product [Acanthosepion pharaonis]|uniref:Uncharacterized protein n=1 Tax=Acanthosepion pharaonis TaxID=158019 RepID=A0A812DRW4_ACAPH|nr:unnamed protein product [Sepia pharaonis]
MLVPVMDARNRLDAQRRGRGQFGQAVSVDKPQNSFAPRPADRSAGGTDTSCTDRIGCALTKNSAGLQRLATFAVKLSPLHRQADTAEIIAQHQVGQPIIRRLKRRTTVPRRRSSRCRPVADIAHTGSQAQAAQRTGRHPPCRDHRTGSSMRSIAARPAAGCRGRYKSSATITSSLAPPCRARQLDTAHRYLAGLHLRVAGDIACARARIGDRQRCGDADRRRTG